MEFKGTKGKWNLVLQDKWPFSYDIQNEDYSERILFGINHYSTEDKTIEDCLKRDYNINSLGLANAKLISCALELLTDLNDIVWLIERGATMEELEERIKTSKQLIKKATEI
jgi:hypothetical protein